MAAALDRVAEDRKEFLAQIDKLDSSISAMSGMLAEMRAAFGSMVRRTEALEKDGERCEKLEARVGSLENWRANRRRTVAAIAAAAGAAGSVLLQVVLQLAGYFLAAR
jgi:regulator of replication initiation timing